MIVLVKVERKFTGGALQGIMIQQQWKEDASEAPKVGTTRSVPKPYVNSSPYRDKVLSVEPAR